MLGLALAATLAISAPAPAATTTAGGVTLHMAEPTREVFANGLRTIVMEDHAAPVVAVQVWYHVGSKDEVPGKRGLAHLFEHLMFRGTKRFGPGVFDARLDAVGGINNAFTTEDATAYHETLPAEALDVALELEADRMRGLDLNAETIAAEREVVKEEKRLRLENDPVGKTIEAFRATAYTKHPYAWTPAGTLSDLDSVTVDEARAFYDRYYTPDDAVLVIVGDVSTSDALARAHRFFDAVPKGHAPARAIPVEPPQGRLREKTLTLDTELPMIVCGWHVPGIRAPETAALDVLGVILSDGESARLHRVLVKQKKLAVFASGSSESLEDPGLFMAIVGFLPDVDPVAVKAALEGEIESIARDGVTAHELERAKNQLLADHVFGLDTAEGIGLSLGSAETVEGDYRRFLDETTKYGRVTADDVREVAKRWLVTTNLTRLTVVPKEAP